MRFKNPTAEEIEIDEAMDIHQDALQFEHFVFKVAILTYLVGFPFFIFGEGWVERIGMTAVLVGLFSMLYHFILHIGTEKKRRAVQELLQPYLKRKSLPLLQDLREKFADDPNIRFVHEDNGGITVMRKESSDERNSN